MSTDKEKSFIRLIVAAERRILGYLVTLLGSVQDAEDLMQETSIVMWEKYDEFLATQGGAPELGRFIAWGNKIAFYKVLNSRRQKRGASRLLSEDVLKLVSDEWVRQEQTSELEVREKLLATCVEELPASRREVLLRYYWRRLPVDQIAAELKRSTDGIYKVLARTRQALHRCIGQKMGQNPSIGTTI